MEIDAIIDRETLERWLNARPEATRQSDAIAIAFRAASRVMPVYGREMRQDWAGKAEVTALPILRCLLTAGVARRYPTPEVKAAAYAAAIALSATNSALPESALSAATSAFSSALAAGSAHFTDAAAIAADAAVAWEQIRIDCRALVQGQDPDTMPLWHAAANPLLPAWTETRALWQQAAPAFDFWLRWYQSLLDATPLPPALLHAIALIPTADWQQGPRHVAELIVGIELSFAVGATRNGEAVEVNPATGKLRLVPDSALPTDVATYALRKLVKARALFPDQVEQQHMAIAPELALLSQAIEDSANLPVELFDTCASISRRIAVRVRNGECPSPEQDPVLGDFLFRMRDVGADILANDPKTQEVLSKRNEILGNSALLDGRSVLIAASQEISALSEGPLARLPSVVETATNLKADAEDRKVASYKVAGRVVRVVSVIKNKALWVGGAVVASGGAALTIEGLANSPALNAAFNALMKWLGF